MLQATAHLCLVLKGDVLKYGADKTFLPAEDLHDFGQSPPPELKARRDSCANSENKRPSENAIVQSTTTSITVLNPFG